MHAKHNVFCTPAGVVWDERAKKMFLVAVHINDESSTMPVFDQTSPVFIRERKKLLNSLDIFNMDNGVLIHFGFDSTTQMQMFDAHFVQRGENCETAEQRVKDWAAMNNTTTENEDRTRIETSLNTARDV